MRKTVLLLLASTFALFGGACSGIDTGSSLYGPSGTGISWHGFVAGSPTSTFRRDISGDPVDSRSATWLNTMSSWSHSAVAPPDSVFVTDVDFGGDPWGGYNLHYVHGDTQRRIVVRDNPSPREGYGGDPGTFPVPNKPRIQSWYGPFSRPWDGVRLDTYAGNETDQHLFVVDVDNCISYELYKCYDDGSNLSCGAYLAYYLTGGDVQVPYDTTGAGVSGMPFLLGLVRHEEITSGQINHALGITVLPNLTTEAYTGAATHAQCRGCGSGESWDPTHIPFGAMLRLKPGYDSSSWDPTGACSVYMTAMKKYGLRVFDGGASGDLLGETQYQWTTGCNRIYMLSNMVINPTNFDVIQTGEIHCVFSASGCPDGNRPEGSAPTIASFTASAPTMILGQPVTLSWNVTGVVDVDGNAVPLRNIAYNYAPRSGHPEDPPAQSGYKLGPGWINAALHGEAVLVTPRNKGVYTYQLMVRNRFGPTKAIVTVMVN
jgi:hypothetical protein